MNRLTLRSFQGNTECNDPKAHLQQELNDIRSTRHIRGYRPPVRSAEVGGSSVYSGDSRSEKFSGYNSTLTGSTDKSSNRGGNRLCQCEGDSSCDSQATTQCSTNSSGRSQNPALLEKIVVYTKYPSDCSDGSSCDGSRVTRQTLTCSCGGSKGTSTENDTCGPSCGQDCEDPECYFCEVRREIDSMQEMTTSSEWSETTGTQTDYTGQSKPGCGCPHLNGKSKNVTFMNDKDLYSLNNSQDPQQIINNMQGPPLTMNNTQGPPQAMNNMQGIGTPQAMNNMQGIGTPQEINYMQGPQQAMNNMQVHPQTMNNMQGPPQNMNNIQGYPQGMNNMQCPAQAMNIVQGFPQTINNMQGPPQYMNNIQGHPQAMNNTQCPPHALNNMQGLPQTMNNIQSYPQMSHGQGGLMGGQTQLQFGNYQYLASGAPRQDLEFSRKQECGIQTQLGNDWIDPGTGVQGKGRSDCSSCTRTCMKTCCAKCQRRLPQQKLTESRGTKCQITEPLQSSQRSVRNCCEQRPAVCGNTQSQGQPYPRENLCGGRTSQKCPCDRSNVAEFPSQRISVKQSSNAGTTCPCPCNANVQTQNSCPPIRSQIHGRMDPTPSAGRLQSMSRGEYGAPSPYKKDVFTNTESWSTLQMPTQPGSDGRNPKTTSVTYNLPAEKNVVSSPQLMSQRASWRNLDGENNEYVTHTRSIPISGISTPVQQTVGGRSQTASPYMSSNMQGNESFYNSGNVISNVPGSMGSVGRRSFQNVSQHPSTSQMPTNNYVSQHSSPSQMQTDNYVSQHSSTSQTPTNNYTSQPLSTSSSQMRPAKYDASDMLMQIEKGSPGSAGISRETTRRESLTHAMGGDSQDQSQQNTMNSNIGNDSVEDRPYSMSQSRSDAHCCQSFHQVRSCPWQSQSSAGGKNLQKKEVVLKIIISSNVENNQSLVERRP